MILTILRILYLRLRNNPLELLLVFVMPVIFFSIFAAIFSNGIATGNDKKLRIGWIVDRATALGDELREFMEKNSSLECLPLRQDSSVTLSPDNQSSLIGQKDYDVQQSKLTIEQAQRSGRYDLIVRIPIDFPSELSSVNADSVCRVILVSDGQNPMALSMVTSVINGFFSQKRANLIAQQLTKANSMNSLARESRSAVKSNVPVVRQVGSNSSANSRPPAAYLGPIQEPSQIVAKGTRFYDPTRSKPWSLSERAEKILQAADIVASSSSQPNGGLVDRMPQPQVETEQLTGPVAQSVLLEEQLPQRPSTANSSTANSSTVTISVENPQSANQVNPRIAMYAAGIAVLFLLFSSTGQCSRTTGRIESGTLDRILISKAGLFQIVAGKWLGIFLLGCLQISVMFLWAELVFKIQLWKHLPGFAVMTACTAAATSSFAMLLATLCSSRAQLNAVSVVVILSMSAVGGSMIPRFAMSDRMKEIGQWTFNAWALDGYQKVFWFQSPISTLQTEVTVLLASAIIFGALASILSLRWKYN